MKLRDARLCLVTFRVTALVICPVARTSAKLKHQAWPSSSKSAITICPKDVQLDASPDLSWCLEHTTC